MPESLDMSFDLHYWNNSNIDSGQAPQVCDFASQFPESEMKFPK